VQTLIVTADRRFVNSFRADPGPAREGLDLGEEKAKTGRIKAKCRTFGLESPPRCKKRHL